MSSFSKQKILVIGDVMLDRYLEGSCNRISPEAPVPVVRVSKSEDRLGGAANAALNLSMAGCDVTLYSLVGNDEHGHVLKSFLSQYSIRDYCHPLLKKTTLKLRVLAQSQQLVRLDFEDKVPSDLAREFALDHLLAQLIEKNDLILISDYMKGTLQYVDEIIKICNEFDKEVVVDPKSSDPSIYSGATMLTPNRREFEDFFGVSIADEELVGYAHRLIEQLNLKALVVTLSEKGILCATPTEAKMLPTVAREVVDVTGAGDVFVSWLSSMYASGKDVFEASSVANIAAGLSVEKVGAVPISQLDIESSTSFPQALSRKSFPSIEIAIEELSRVRANSKKIVFTNGCFDVIHAGHVSYLLAAKELGDILIVGINDDDSVRRLKGASRPVNTLGDRISVLAAMSCIDFILPFSHDTPLELIKTVSPDVLVKGGDYLLKDIVGHDFVVANGGSVLTLPFVDGLSTSLTLQKLAR